MKKPPVNRTRAVARPDAGASAPVIASRRLWWFRVVMLGLPLVLLAALELGLRLGGYGYDTAFFAKSRGADGRAYLINSETFSRRFFPAELARWPGPFRIEAQKPPGLKRIFIFGESAAMGDPQPAYGASRYLEVLLRERFPNEQFEVVNLGITAINSHVIRPIAQECVSREGDVWIIYMGNNEMVGPFGAATVFGLRGAPPWLARLSLGLRRFRVGQLAEAILRKCGGESAGSTSWGGMRMFLQNQVAPNDRRKESVYRNFEANLRDVLAAGRASGADVILSTVAVNLRDCPPFGSLVNSNQPAATQEQFGKLYAAALAFAETGNHAEAVRHFESAAKLNPQVAELEYRWGQCLWLSGSRIEAGRVLQRACDDDTLPFRADSRINGTIRKLARERTGERLRFCDAEAALNTESPAGAESFFEHVHFNFDGNYRLARAWAEQVEKVMGAAVANVSWATQEDCERQLGLTDFNRAYVLQSVMRRMEAPPLNSQFNNPERVQSLQAEEARAQSRMNQPLARFEAQQLIEGAVRRRPGDHYLLEGLGNLLESFGDKAGASEAYRRAFELQPQDYYSRLRLGEVLGESGRFAEAVELLAGVVKLRPGLPEGWHSLGTVQMAQGEFERAITSFGRAEQLRPQEAGYAYYKIYCAGRVLAKTGRHAQALAKYREAMTLLPANWEAHYEAGGELDAANQLDAAAKEFGEAVRLNPGHARAHFNYGVLLAKLGRLDDAQRQFEESIRLEPGYANAHDYAAKVRALKERPPVSAARGNP